MIRIYSIVTDATVIYIGIGLGYIDNEKVIIFHCVEVEEHIQSLQSISGMNMIA